MAAAIGLGLLCLAALAAAQTCSPGYSGTFPECIAVTCPIPNFKFSKTPLAGPGTCTGVTTDNFCRLGCVAGYEVIGEDNSAECTGVTVGEGEPAKAELQFGPYPCTDIDECGFVPPSCGDGWACTNLPGTYSCTPLAPSLVWIKDCSSKRRGGERYRRGGRHHGEGEGDRRGEGEGRGHDRKLLSGEGQYYTYGEGEGEGTHDRIPKARLYWPEVEDFELCVGLEWAALGPYVQIDRLFLHVSSSFRSWELDDIANPDITTTVTVKGLKRGTTYSFNLVAITPAGVQHGKIFKMTTPSSSF